MYGEGYLCRQCEKCDGINDRWEYSNYCSKCAEEYHNRVKAEISRTKKANDDFWAKRNPY